MTEFSTSSKSLNCDYFPTCSGCEIQGDVSSPPISQKVVSFFNKFAYNKPISLKINKITGWRVRAKLAVRGGVLDPEIGLFKRGSHQVISIPRCPLHHPSINLVCDKVKKIIIELKVEPYQEEKGTGLLRYLQFVVEEKTQRVQLTLVVNTNQINSFIEKLVKRLYSECHLHSIWLNFQAEKSNRIFGDHWLWCEGEPYLWESLNEIACAFHPACFGQAHRSLFVEVLKQIQNWVKPGQNVLELYAGIGVIGLNLARISKQVTCVEINPFASECFHLSRLKLSPEVQKRISLKISSSSEAISSIEKNEVIIVDPPRKGLEAKVLDALCQTKEGTQLIYLSCGPVSLQKDCEKLLMNGWKIEEVETYLFFPGNDHVEILCSLRKQSG